MRHQLRLPACVLPALGVVRAAAPPSTRTHPPALPRLPTACDPSRERSQPLDSMIAGLMELLRGGGDSGGQAAARAIKNLSAGHASSAKVGGGQACRPADADVAL